MTAAKLNGSVTMVESSSIAPGKLGLSTFITRVKNSADDRKKRAMN